MAYLTIEQINSNPIYAPLDYTEDFTNRIRKELCEEINTPNMKILYKNYLKARKIKIDDYGYWDNMGGKGGNVLTTIFGTHRSWTNKFNEKLGHSGDDWCFERNGIEVLGVKPSHKTSDGKFKYEGLSIVDMRKMCKMNGVKGYSKADKLGLVKILMGL
tara:strand:- start:89 stop:565 length:477 start_codon:yes stop_codon:yes gene_type:complete